MSRTNSSSQVRFMGIVIAMFLPTIVTWLYFVVLEGHPLQKAAFAAKVLQFAFPLVWLLAVLKQPLRDAGLADGRNIEADRREPKRKSLGFVASIGFGVVMGLAVIALMWGIYQSLADATLTSLIVKARAKIDELGFASPILFAGLGVFYALVHSFLEEYYFRWFVYGQLRRIAGVGLSMLLSGLAFMAHHVIILVIYFGWTPLAAFLSLSIAVGGMIWAWQYEKSRSLVGPWISHMIVDAGIFYVGYDLLRNAGIF